MLEVLHHSRSRFQAPGLPGHPSKGTHCSSAVPAGLRLGNCRAKRDHQLVGRAGLDRSAEVVGGHAIATTRRGAAAN